MSVQSLPGDTGHKTRLILQRHGRTAWNHTGRFQGQTDISLDQTGLEQAAKAAPRLARLHPVAIIASPLQRTQQTADALSAVLDVPRLSDDRLMEIHVGQWSGLTADQVAALDPGYAPGLRAGHDLRRSPTGETATEVGERVGEALREIADQYRGQTVVVVSHGVAIKMGIAQLMGWNFAQAWWLEGMGNCHWAEVSTVFTGTPDERFRLSGYNLS